MLNGFYLPKEDNSTTATSCQVSYSLFEAPE